MARLHMASGVCSVDRGPDDAKLGRLGALRGFVGRHAVVFSIRVVVFGGGTGYRRWYLAEMARVLLGVVTEFDHTNRKYVQSGHYVVG